MKRVMVNSKSRSSVPCVTFHSLMKCTGLCYATLVVSTLVVPTLSACAGTSSQPEYPGEPPSKEEAADPSWETGDSNARDGELPAVAAQEPEAERKKPEFTEGMGVDQAIAAVPEDYEYIGLDQDVLAKPLTQLDTYQECKIKQSDKFKVRIAVWDGKVVGANVTSPNKALAQCIDGVVRKLEYKDRVEAINTVEYSF